MILIYFYLKYDQVNLKQLYFYFLIYHQNHYLYLHLINKFFLHLLIYILYNIFKNTIQIYVFVISFYHFQITLLLFYYFFVIIASKYIIILVYLIQQLFSFHYLINVLNHQFHYIIYYLHLINYLLLFHLLILNQYLIHLNDLHNQIYFHYIVLYLI